MECRRIHRAAVFHAVQNITAQDSTKTITGHYDTVAIDSSHRPGYRIRLSASPPGKIIKVSLKGSWNNFNKSYDLSLKDGFYQILAEEIDGHIRASKYQFYFLVTRAIDKYSNAPLRFSVDQSNPSSEPKIESNSNPQ